MYIYYDIGVNKHQRIQKGQSKMDNLEKLASQGTQDEEIQSKNTTRFCAKSLISTTIASNLL